MGPEGTLNSAVLKGWVAKLDENSDNWQDYPYLVEWVEKMNQWARDYQIYEFIPADDEGQDPSGRTPNWHLADSENEGKLDTRFIWTSEDDGSRGGRWITSEFSNGSFRNRGWYLGRVPHEKERLISEAGKIACTQCQGTELFEDSEGDEVDCDLCWDGDSVFIDLEDTDFSIGT